MTVYRMVDKARWFGRIVNKMVNIIVNRIVGRMVGRAGRFYRIVL